MSLEPPRIKDAIVDVETPRLDNASDADDELVEME